MIRQAMYMFVVFIHSLLRWLVLAVGVVAITRAVRGRSGHTAWTTADNHLTLGFAVLLDLQLLVGLVLFWYSPITILGRHEIDLTLRSSVLRFFTLAHPIGMFLAVALAHVARVRIRRGLDAASRYRETVIFGGLALLIVLAATPWPGLPYGRSLLSYGR